MIVLAAQQLNGDHCWPGWFNLTSGAWTQFADSSFFLWTKHLQHYSRPSLQIELLSDPLQLPAPFFSAQIQSWPFLKGLILIWHNAAQCSSRSRSDRIWYYLYVCMVTGTKRKMDDNVFPLSCGVVLFSVHWKGKLLQHTAGKSKSVNSPLLFQI